MCFVNLLDDKEAKAPNIHNKPGKVKTDEQEPDGELHDKAQDIPNIKRHKEEVNLKVIKTNIYCLSFFVS
jgi:hypothetical protein